ncbi:MAG: lysophospholipid acyltransferase family protein [Thermoanaerobaculia bacterium]|nr:lysophospholipid acyltransferase family protein [Thermoanaerobaculia bacterium]
MKDAHLQHAVEFAAYRLFVRWLHRRRHEDVAAPGRRLGRLAYRLLRSKRRLAERNVARVFPELDGAAGQRIVELCFEHFGAYFLEVVSAGRLDRGELLSRFELSGLEHLEHALSGPRGCFLTTGHFGTWELAMFPLADWATRHGRSFHAVARPLDNPRIDADLRASRGRYGVEIIDKAGAAHRMLNAYRRGGLVAIVIDQHVRESAGIRVPFFGEPAWTSPVLATLSLRTGAPVVPFTCLPAGPGRYRLVVHEAIEPASSDLQESEAEAEMTRLYLAAVERDIREQPEYWLWMHRRWR